MQILQEGVVVDLKMLDATMQIAKSALKYHKLIVARPRVLEELALSPLSTVANDDRRPPTRHCHIHVRLDYYELCELLGSSKG